MVRKNSPLDHRNDPFRWIAGSVFVFLAVVWGGLMFNQPIAKNTTRLMLFLVPDELIDTWIDGPMSFQGWIDRGVVMGIALAAMVPAALGGWLVFRRSGLMLGCRRSERAALAVLCGLGLQSQAILFLGLRGALRDPSGPLVIVAAVLASGWVVGRCCRWLEVRTSKVEPGHADIDPNPTANSATLNSETPALHSASCPPTTLPPAIDVGLPRLAFALFATILVLRAMMPPAEYDVREYHLQAAKEWWQEGEIHFMPHNIYANMPMSAECQSVFAMMLWDFWGAKEDAWWWGALSGKVVIACYALAMAILVGGIVRILLQSCGVDLPAALRIARWIRVLALSFPALIEGASVGLIEAAVAAYLAAGILVAVLYRWRWSEFQPGTAMTVVAWNGLFAGMSLGCKYTALVLVIPPLLLTLFWSLSTTLKSPAKPLRTALIDFVRDPRRPAVWIAFGLVGGGLWYWKNLALTGNPVYPLAGTWLGGETLSAEKIAQWNQAHRTPGYSIAAAAGSIQQLLWQWRLQDWCLIPLCGLALCSYWRPTIVHRSLSQDALASAHWRNPLPFFVFTSMVVLAIWWSITHRVDRFLVPAAPLVFVIAGLGLFELSRLWGERVLVVVMVGYATIHGVYDAGPTLGDARMLVDLRYLRVDDLTASSITRMPPHVIWVNRTLSPEDQLLVVGDAAVFDYEVPVVYSTTFDRSVLTDILVSEPEQAQQIFTEQGITHLLIHWAEIERLRSTYGFEALINRDNVARLEQSGLIRPVHEGRGGAYGVWSIR